MGRVASIVVLWFSSATAAEVPLLLVQPPGAEAARLLDAEALHLALALEIPPEALRVRLFETAPDADPRRSLPSATREHGARVALGIELVPPEDCPAPHRLRLILYDARAERLLERELCPGAARGSMLARAVALSVADVLREGWLEGIRIGERPPPPRNERISPPPDDGPARAVPAPAAIPPPATGRCGIRLRLEAGVAFSSQPAWENPGLGPMLRLWLRLSDRFSAGIAFAASREQTLERASLLATWSSWPLALQFRLRLGGERLAIFWQSGVFLAFTNLTAMLVEESQPRLVRRLDPGLSSHATLLIHLRPGLSLGLEAGPAVYLLRQRYQWGEGQNRKTVLSMAPVALEVGVFLSASVGEEAP